MRVHLMDANYNLSGLVARIKARLKDAEFSDEDIVQFLNDAQFEILGDAEYKFLEKVYEQQVQQGGAVLLPRDFQALIHMTAEAKHNLAPMEYMPSKDYFDAKGSGYRWYKYCVFGANLFYDLPNISDDLDEQGDEEFYTLRVFYLAKPTMLVESSDKPLIPAEYGEALLLMALARCEQTRDNYDIAQLHENKAEELITNMKVRYCPRQLEDANRSNLPITFRTRY